MNSSDLDLVEYQNQTVMYFNVGEQVGPIPHPLGELGAWARRVGGTSHASPHVLPSAVSVRMDGALIEPAPMIAG